MRGREFRSGRVDKRRSRSYTAIVVLLRHEYVAIIAPIGGPGVLDQPILLPSNLAIPHGQNSVVQIVGLVLALGLVVDATAVKGQGLVRGIDAYRDGSVLGNGHLQSVEIARGDIDIVFDLEEGLGRVPVAEAVLAKVRAVVFLSWDATMLQHELVHPKVFSAITAIVAKAPGAIHQGLLRQSGHLTRLQEESSFQGANCAKGPARTTDRLILDWRNGSKESPVQLFWSILHILGSVGEGLASIITRSVEPSSHPIHLGPGQVCQVVRGQGVAQPSTIVGMNESLVLPKDVLPLLMVHQIPVLLAMDALELFEGSVDVISVVIHKLLHWIHVINMLVARTWPARARSGLFVKVKDQVLGSFRNKELKKKGRLDLLAQVFLLQLTHRVGDVVMIIVRSQQGVGSLHLVVQGHRGAHLGVQGGGVPFEQHGVLVHLFANLGSQLPLFAVLTVVNGVTFTMNDNCLDILKKT